MTSLTVEVATIQVSGRASIAGGVDFDVSPSEQLEEYAILLGKAWHRDDGITFYGSAGLGLAKTTTRGRFLYQEDEGFGSKVYEARKDRGVGVPLELGLAWDRKTVGLGLALVANINQTLSVVGIVGTLRIGKLQW